MVKLKTGSELFICRRAHGGQINNSDPVLCPSFGACGGCLTQDRSYQDQLAYKQTYITNLLAQFHPQEVHDIIPSPQIWHFRNKMEFAVSGTADAPLVGLRPQEKFSEVVDISECRIFYPQVNAVLAEVRGWIREYKVEPYDLKRQKGFLRYVGMRHSKASGEVMVILAARLRTEEFERRREIFVPLVERLSSTGSVASVYVSLNPGASDTALGTGEVLLHGAPYIREQVNGIDYRIRPRSFFQTNPYCCSRLYDVIRGQAGPCAGTVLDLFCGCGGISLQIAAGAGRVTGIDIIEQNIEDARANCRANGVSNAEFVCRDAQAFLAEAAGSGKLRSYSCLIVDPPRQGLTKKDRAFIVESGIGHVVYVSCNPWNLVQDLKTLLPAYSVQAVHPVDMFPHTPHMETVVRLVRQ
ncbi:MAG TPA: 23S rRNA (uracil(1939)-C(5))-methyltransferase RlmD [Candidatus Omnitrophota bacterium]|nr:23S rRNA (uracil(1939)-C(5))-methyltransferase RlmD [Candidatus Omnitrophota bacterium]HNQ50503.1 23S rRNA (uracil(1939)-C(5))-methyltransferase RlmD [Candidatus Omnitrophota bacterium]HQO38096.1 23S rRNA (uracil(1939)-C(5))-methyltransferase RlmD [Candidatus Omnitrophota bacterium]HQQ06070.1 23S rRNA (uracil(1939)-C(5))-methyltransferase RlmD [Candidatus Omnitrophota bacterium]